MSEELLRTPLAAEHVKLGAKMVPFAGWEMPVQYTEGIIAEHKHTREHCSIFDICHMGEFQVAGEGAAAALDGLLLRKVSDLPVGSCRYNLLLNDAGKVLDDLVVYRMKEDDFFIVVNAGTALGDAEWFDKHLPQELDFQDLSDVLAKIDIQGPKSAEVMAKLGIEAAVLPGYFKWMHATIDGVKCILSRTGYTGELGFEIYFNEDFAVRIWNKLLSIEGVKPAGLGARDTLRLEMGYSLYGHELNTEITPVDGGLGAFYKPDEERDFVGKAALAADSGKWQTVGVKLESRRAARADHTVLDADGKVIGKVTSGAFCPSLDIACSLCRVERSKALPVGSKVLIDIGKAQLPATVVPLPFYENGTVRAKIC